MCIRDSIYDASACRWDYYRSVVESRTATDTLTEIDHITRDGVTITRVEPDGYTVDADDDADRWGAVRRMQGVWSWTLYERRSDDVGEYSDEIVGERAETVADAVRALARTWAHYAQH